MENMDFRNELIRFFRSNTKFIIAEVVLIFLTIILFTDESGFWVFSSFVGILLVLFYIGINLDYWTGKRMGEDEVFIYNHLQKMADEARASMQSIKEMENELNGIKSKLNRQKV